jgi:spore maturation protein SpmA
MVLNYIWIAFFLVAFVVAMGKLIFGGDVAVFTDIINASFDSAKERRGYPALCKNGCAGVQ